VHADSIARSARDCSSCDSQRFFSRNRSLVERSYCTGRGWQDLGDISALIGARDRGICSRVCHDLSDCDRKSAFGLRAAFALTWLVFCFRDHVSAHLRGSLSSTCPLATGELPSWPKRALSARPRVHARPMCTGKTRTLHTSTSGIFH